jgi:TRAP-type C4-dicarboxylate transport system permease small subunit
LLAAIDKRVDALVIFLERVLAVGLLLGLSLNFINVIGRYLGGYALNGAAELEIYILIWITFLGAAFVTWRDNHLRMDVLIEACPPTVKWLVGLFEMALMLIIFSFVAWHSFRYVERIYALGAVSDIAGIPTWIPHSAIAAGFGAMALIVLLRGIQRIAAGRPVNDTAERAKP